VSSGISSSVSVAADVTNVVVRAGDPGYSLGAIRAAYFDSSGVLADTTAEVSTVYIKAGGASYTDYGLQIHTESNNLTAAAMIKTFGSNLLPIGLQFNGANSGTITNAINFTGTVTNVLDFASTDGTNGADISARFVGADITGADAAVKIDIGGTSYYIPAWVAGDVTGSW